jgi:glycosyltransferase involved in cell wall biosynthesis
VVYEDLDCYGVYGRDPARRAVVTFIESQCLRRAAAVITVGSVLAARAKRYRTEGIHVIPNGVDFDRFASAREERDEGLVVVHGSLERWIGLEDALSALALLKQKGVRVRMKIAGTGPALGLFQGRAATLGLGEVVDFLGPIDYGEVSRLLARASVGLLCFPDTPFMRCAATLKLIECMAAGLPVVATDVGETANVVRATGAGVVVGHSPDEIAEGILSLLMGPGLRRRMGRRGRRAAQKLDWGKLAEDESSVLLDAMTTSEPRVPPGPPPRLMARA